MREYFIFLVVFFSIIFAASQCSTENTKDIIEKQNITIDSLTGELAKIKLELDTCESALENQDSLMYENFVLNYKIERIKEYDSIVIRNSSQSKYFRGWIRRVIYE